MPNYFVTAIDTDAGKTIVTGLLGKYLKDKKADVVTMKLAQTGCEKVSDDILVHRQIMKEELSVEDREGLTCPYLLKFPASPHLAADMEGKTIDCDHLVNTIKALEQKHDQVLIEGVGGLMVPINHDVLLCDFIQEQQLPVILVTSGRLGSINHTLLSLEVMKNRGISLYGLIYNHYPVTEQEITDDSAKVLKKHLSNYFPNALWGEVPVVHSAEEDICLEISKWFED